MNAKDEQRVRVSEPPDQLSAAVLFLLELESDSAGEHPGAAAPGASSRRRRAYGCFICGYGTERPQHYRRGEVRLAAYGSLAPGRPNHAQLSDPPGRWLVGHVRGTLVEGGWGATLGYPGLIVDPDGALIEVFVFESAEVRGHWVRLDAFEGPGYRRVVVDVSTAEGALPASIYVLADPSG
jgi:gamma-glutamylcyclotransferase (GGCT)/AIG2-like uncharacterized protein YtfP